jgi:hypothetical protein
MRSATDVPKARLTHATVMSADILDFTALSERAGVEKAYQVVRSCLRMSAPRRFGFRERSWRSAFEGTPADARQSLRRLLGCQCVKVHGEAKKGFALTGNLGLTLETERDAAGGPRRLVSVVAGVRFDRLHTGRNPPGLRVQLRFRC